MNTSISINRILLLSKAIGIQNWARDWKFFLIVFVLLTVSKVMSLAAWSSALPFVVVIILLYLAGTTYKLFTDPKHGMFYSTIPASAAEKFIVNAFFVHIYYVVSLIVISIVSYYLGAILNQLLEALFSGNPFVYESIYPMKFDANFGRGLLVLMAAQSLLMFGSLYFKRYAILKTILAVVVLSLGVLILDSSIFFVIVEKWSNVHISNEVVATNVFYVFFPLTAIYFWVMTYICLKETEV